MRKTLATIAILALLAIPMIAFAGQASSPVLNGTPEPEGEPIACEEGQVTVEESEWVCTWVDTSYDYEATFNEAETEWQCPDGFTPSRNFPGGDEACVRRLPWLCPEGFTPTRNFPDGDEACLRVVWVDDERVVEYARAISRVEYARAIEVEIAPAYFSCDGEPAGELEGDTCYVEQGKWDCGWTEPLCRTPEVVKIDVCHQAGPRNFVLVPVSIHSVNDANGLNGHGRHGGDAWNPFVFDGQQYAGQGDFPGGCGEEPTPNEALVGVSLGCSRESEGGTVYQLDFGVTVEPAGGAIVFFNGNEYTESTGGYIGFGRYDWSAEAAEGFEIVGDDEGTVKLKRDDCNAEEPPEHPPTGADPNAALAVVTALTGFALAGIGGSILFMKRRASR